MKIAETVTFGGAGLDRAAALRDQPIGADARFVLFWRGKPMLDHADRLVRVSADHPIMADAGPLRVFLARYEGHMIYAVDLSAWEPADADLSALDTFADASLQQHPAAAQTDRFAELRSVMTRLSPAEAELAAMAKAVLGWHVTHRFCAACGVQSVPKAGGWQRDCPDCGAHHFPRTDPVVIMLITHGNDILIGRSPGWPEGMYSLLAGFVEPGETMEAAVRREVFEEVGVTVGPVSYLASQPWPFPASLMLGCAGQALDKALTLDPAEIEDALWLSREDMAMAFAGQHPTILPARAGAIAHFLIENWLKDRLD